MQYIARRITVVLVMGALMLALAGGTALAQEASGASNEGLFFTGTSGSDAVGGASGDDFLFDDQGGDDFLFDNQGGNDFLFDDEGNDRAESGTGNDRVMTGAGNDRTEGGAGNDQIFGGEGNDALFGNDDNDEIFGDAGNDEIFGDAGDDYLFSAGDNEADAVEGGLGFDTCVVDQQDSVSGCENVITR